MRWSVCGGCDAANLGLIQTPHCGEFPIWILGEPFGEHVVLPRRIAIVGSREYPDPEQVIEFVDSLPLDMVVISGGAKGVDTWAEERAKERKMPEPEIHRVSADEYRIYRNAAYHRRNGRIVAANISKMAAFHDGSSRGTRDAIIQAREAGILVEIFRPRRGR